MIVEQRLYTLQPGKANEYLQAYEQEGRVIQEAALGRPMGYYVSDLGPLNQLMQLWVYKNYAERTERRALLAKNQAWLDYGKKVRALINSQEVRIMRPAAFWEKPLQTFFDTSNGARAVATSKPGIVELRLYTVKPEHLKEYAQRYQDSGWQEQKPILGNFMGRYLTETGALNTIVQLWAYESMDDRAERRARLQANEKWMAYSNSVTPFLTFQENRVFNIAPFFLPQLQDMLNRVRYS